MKKVFYFYSILSLVSVLMFSSCSDESCDDQTLSEIIVGSWTSEFGSSTIDFLADGTLIDPEDDLIAFESNGVVYSEKSYTVVSDTEIILRAADPNNNVSSFSFPVDVVGYDCDKITLSVLGINSDLKRQ